VAIRPAAKISAASIKIASKRGRRGVEKAGATGMEASLGTSLRFAGGEECQLICSDISIEVECSSNGRAELRLLLVKQNANPVSQSVDRDRGDVVATDN
jgi:hypothetical protein